MTVTMEHLTVHSTNGLNGRLHSVRPIINGHSDVATNGTNGTAHALGETEVRSLE